MYRARYPFDTFESLLKDIVFFYNIEICNFSQILVEFCRCILHEFVIKNAMY